MSLYEREDDIEQEGTEQADKLNQIESGKIKCKTAAELLGLSIRQVRRILAAYRSRVAGGLAHGNRGSKPC